MFCCGSLHVILRILLYSYKAELFNEVSFENHMWQSYVCHQYIFRGISSVFDHAPSQSRSANTNSHREPEWQRRASRSGRDELSLKWLMDPLLSQSLSRRQNGSAIRANHSATGHVIRANHSATGHVRCRNTFHQPYVGPGPYRCVWETTNYIYCEYELMWNFGV